MAGRYWFTTLGVLPVNHTAFAMSATLNWVNQDQFLAYASMNQSLSNSRTSHHHPCPTQFFHVFSEIFPYPQTAVPGPVAAPFTDAAFRLALRALHAQRDASPAPAPWTGRPVAEYLTEDFRSGAMGPWSNWRRPLVSWRTTFLCMMWGLWSGYKRWKYLWSSEDCYN